MKKQITFIMVVFMLICIFGCSSHIGNTVEYSAKDIENELKGYEGTQFESGAEISERVIVDEKMLKVTVKGVNYDDANEEVDLELFIENKSGKKLKIYTENEFINEYMYGIFNIYDQVIGVNEVKTLNIKSSYSNLESSGIDQIRCFGFDLFINDVTEYTYWGDEYLSVRDIEFRTDKYDDAYSIDKIKLKKETLLSISNNNYGSDETATRIDYLSTEDLYKNDQVEVLLEMVSSTKTENGSTYWLKIMVYNPTDKNIDINMSNFKINDVLVMDTDDYLNRPLIKPKKISTFYFYYSTTDLIELGEVRTMSVDIKSKEYITGDETRVFGGDTVNITLKRGTPDISVPGEEVYNDNGITINYVGLEMPSDSKYGYIYFWVDNSNNDKGITFDISNENFEVNGREITGYFIPMTVPKGCKAIYSTLVNAENMGITDKDDIGKLSFDIILSDTFGEVIDQKSCKLYR